MTREAKEASASAKRGHNRRLSLAGRGLKEVRVLAPVECQALLHELGRWLVSAREEVEAGSSSRRRGLMAVGRALVELVGEEPAEQKQIDGKAFAAMIELLGGERQLVHALASMGRYLAELPAPKHPAQPEGPSSHHPDVDPEWESFFSELDKVSAPTKTTD